MPSQHSATMHLRRTMLSAVVLSFVVGAPHGHAAEVRDWVAELAARTEEIRDRGEPVTFDEFLAGREAWADDENGVPVLLNAFADLDFVQGGAANAGGERLSGGTQLGERHSPAGIGILRHWLAQYETSFDLMAQASELRPGPLPVDPAENPFSVTFDHLMTLRSAARLLCARAVLNAETGRPDAAAADLIVTSRMARNLDVAPLFIEMLVRTATGKVLVEAAERALGVSQVSDADLAALAGELLAAAEGMPLTQSLMAEKAARRYMLDMPAADIVASLAALHETMRIPAGAVTPQWRARLLLAYYDMMEGLIAISRLPDAEQLPAARAWSDEWEYESRTDLARDWFAALVTPALARALEEELEGRALLRVAAVALTVDRYRLKHGAWPESLADLSPDLMDSVPADPFTGGGLGYAHTGDGVVIYSVGTDGMDDGGRPVSPGGEEEGTDLTFRLLDADGRGALTQSDDEVELPDARTLLHVAAEVGAIEAVRMLIEQDAEVNATDDHGMTPTRLAVQGWHTEVADLLREHGGVE